MATIGGAIAEIVTVLKTVDGIQQAPDYPMEDVRGTPVAFVYPVSATARREPLPEQKDLHTISIVVITSLNDYRNTMIQMWPLYERVTKALFQWNEARTSTNVSTFGEISAELGPIDWGSGTLNFGWVFTIDGIKIFNSY